MDPPSLLVIASRNVATYILQGKYKDADYAFPEIPSNLVFDIVRQSRMLIESEEHAEQVDKILTKIFNPSIMNLTCHMPHFGVCDGDLVLIQDQKNLVELKIGDIIQCCDHEEIAVEPPRKKTKKQKTAAKSKKAIKYYNLAVFLEQNLNSRTREKLETLDVTRQRWTLGSDAHKYCFQKDWPITLTQTLPSLTTLRIAGQNLSIEEFGNLCDSFPRLLSLDIAETGLTSLAGISKLVNLQEISMGRLNLENAKSMDEVYKLKNLKKLDLSGGEQHGPEFNVISLFINSKKKNLCLEELNCSSNNIEDEDLDGILKRHPNLKRVIALDTKIGRSEIPGIDLLIENSISSCLLTLKHLQNPTTDQLISIIFPLLAMIHQRRVAELTAEELQNSIRMMYHMIPKHDFNSEVIEQIHICCCNLSNPNKLHFYENSDKRVLMESFLRIMDAKGSFNEPETPRDEWEMINTVLKTTQDPQVDRLVSMAIKYLVISEGRDWGYYCLDVIDHLLERINMKSEYYKGMDKKKLTAVLKKISENCSIERKKMTARIEKFFEKL